MNLIQELIVSEQEKVRWLNKIASYKSWDMTQRQICDLELLLNGGFYPLSGFLNEEDYYSVCKTMRLTSGELWPIPITLDVIDDFAANVRIGENIVLCDEEGVPLAILEIESKWCPDKKEEAILVFCTDDILHPAVDYLFNKANAWYLGGKIYGLQLPTYYDYLHHRYTPNQLRSRFTKNGWSNIVAFQTRNPMHRAHFELTLRAAKIVEANLLLHPAVGMTKPGDIDHYTRVKCYEKVITKYPEQTAALSLLPLAMRMGGPREALWHALIRKNYGVTAFIVGRDHAGPGNDSSGKPFYDPYAAQNLALKYADEIGIKIVPFNTVSYVENKAAYLTQDEIEENDKVLDISGTEFRRRLISGVDIPAWFSFPEVISILRTAHPAKNKSGFTVFFTGLSGSGKSTIANALLNKLLEITDRTITLLDGDIVRKNLSSELGFSKEHRDLNILRIGYVAAEITKHRGVAICAPIAPYVDVRKQVRSLIESSGGGFIEIHVATPIDVCEIRDRKGLYKKARQGLLKGFTGIDDPYEEPTQADVIIDTSSTAVLEGVQKILLKLESLDYISGEYGN